MTDAEKKTAVLVALVKAGVVDLESLANGIVKNLPAEFEAANLATNLDPDLGAASSGTIVGRWCVYNHQEQS
ncbi:hypothetical protein V5F59_11480 [Xanthobacter autotrophicus DSM 431]|uniref:hypothetical protein n=1 Tax=Xanthobacter nonsaccharivorans TaxID=3119912 RepID=UPI00372A7780